MKANRRLALGTLAATALAVIGAASAASANPVTVTFTVSAAAGGLTASSAATTLDAGSSAYAGGADHTLTKAMPALTLTDARATLLTGWTLGVSGTAFTNSGPAASSAVVYFPLADVAALTTASTPTGMSLTSCVCNATGVDALALKNLGTAYNLATGIATSLVSTPTAVVTPSFYVNIPGTTPAGSYSTTVTYTLT